MCDGCPELLCSAFWRRLWLALAVCRFLALAAVLFLGITACSSVDSEHIGGLYVWGHEVETFQPCSGPSEFWVAGEESLLKPLREKADEANKAQPYRPVYVEVRAILEGKATDGFAADYDGVYRFTVVKSISSSVPPGCAADG